MTSKISFFKLVRSEMRRMGWLTAVQLVIFGLLIPFRVILVMSQAISKLHLTDAVNRTEIFYGNVGFNLTENTIMILGAGILCALCGFYYIHSAARLDFYHSLSVKREKLFAVKYVSSVLTFVTAYLSSQLLAILLGGFFGALSPGIVLEIAVASLQGILYFLCSYSGALLAMMLTGNMLTAVLAVGVLGLYFPMLRLIELICRRTFLETSLDNWSWFSRAELIGQTSPWAFCLVQKAGLRGGLSGNWPSMVGFVQVLGIVAVLTTVSLVLYRIRKTEAAGNALSFQKTEGIIKLLLTIPVSIVAACVAYQLQDSVVWEAVFILLFGTLGCVIMEVIYRKDIRRALKHKMHILITVAVASVLFFGVRFDVFGYNTYLPEPDKLVSMSVKGTWEAFTYEDESGVWDHFSQDTTKRWLDQTETEKFDDIYRLAVDGVEKQKTRQWKNATMVNIKYHTKGGKETYRRYWVEQELYLDVMDELQKDAGFRKNYYPILSWDEKKINGINGCISGYYYDPMKLLQEDNEEASEPAKTGEETTEYAYNTSPFTPKELRKVIDAYRKDLEIVSYRELWSSPYTLEFHNESWNVDYPVGKAMKNTMEVLREIQSGEK